MRSLQRASWVARDFRTACGRGHGGGGLRVGTLTTWRGSSDPFAERLASAVDARLGRNWPLSSRAAAFASRRRSRRRRTARRLLLERFELCAERLDSEGPKSSSAAQICVESSNRCARSAAEVLTADPLPQSGAASRSRLGRELHGVLARQDPRSDRVARRVLDDRRHRIVAAQNVWRRNAGPRRTGGSPRRRGACGGRTSRSDVHPSHDGLGFVPAGEAAHESEPSRISSVTGPDAAAMSCS